MTDTTFATCRTSGCVNEGVPITVTLDPEFLPMPVFCGPCGQEITDLSGGG